MRSLTQHPSEGDLALYAGNDLGRLARLRVEWHVRSCGQCQQEITEFSSFRVETARNAPEPNVNWDRLAAEMKANIRVGLEAGECVAPVRQREPVGASWSWAVLAAAVLVAVAAGGEIWIHHNFPAEPASRVTEASAFPLHGVVLEIKDTGIQMRSGDTVVREFAKPTDTPVVYSVNAQGGVAASYVDSQTGMVTVNNIYYGQ